MVQEVGHAKLRERGIDLIAADNPGSFIERGASASAKLADALMNCLSGRRPRYQAGKRLEASSLLPCRGGTSSISRSTSSLATLSSCSAIWKWIEAAFVSGIRARRILLHPFLAAQWPGYEYAGQALRFCLGPPGSLSERMTDIRVRRVTPSSRRSSSHSFVAKIF
jgi:hypothetical protein